MALKYFNLSLHRSATKSTAKVFRDSQFTICDWLGWDFEATHQDLMRSGREEELLDVILAARPNATYFGDFPIPLMYKELLPRFPRANYFMVLRDLDSWSDSSFRHFVYTGNHPENPLGPPLTPINQMLLDCYGYLEVGKQLVANQQFASEAIHVWRQIYYKHIISVVEFFGDQRIPLKLFHLSDPDIGPKIKEYACPWLDRSLCMSYQMARLHSDDQDRTAKEVS